MCGIAGWASTIPSIADRSRLRRMCDVQSHRGPDDSGYYLTPDGRVALGHRRLSIVDLSANGHQPMSNEAGTLWISYNGEVYNFQELRVELEGNQTPTRRQRSSPFSSRSISGPGRAHVGCPPRPRERCIR